MAIAPEEAANRQLVQQMAMQGSAAKNQAPSIATAPEAMQTAMQRSAGINAPANFNATQTGTIQNPYTRGDAQLAANNAGAGGVLGAISSSTRDYLQQAQGGVDLQREISRRAVQQSLSDHELQVMQHQVGMLNAKAALAEAQAAADPNSPEAQYKAQKAKNDLIEENRRTADLALPNKPSAIEQVSAQTGIPKDTIHTLQSLPAYANDVADVNLKAQAGWTADQLASYISGIADAAVADKSGNSDPAKAAEYSHMLYATLGPTAPGYNLSLAGGPNAGPPVQPGMPGLTSMPSGGTANPNAINDVRAFQVAQAAQVPQATQSIPQALTQAIGAPSIPANATNNISPIPFITNADSKKLAEGLLAANKKSKKK